MLNRDHVPTENEKMSYLHSFDPLLSLHGGHHAAEGSVQLNFAGRCGLVLNLLGGVVVGWHGVALRVPAHPVRA